MLKTNMSEKLITSLTLISLTNFSKQVHLKPKMDENIYKTKKVAENRKTINNVTEIKGTIPYVVKVRKVKNKAFLF